VVWQFDHIQGWSRISPPIINADHYGLIRIWEQEDEIGRSQLSLHQRNEPPSETEPWEFWVQVSFGLRNTDICAGPPYIFITNAPSLLIFLRKYLPIFRAPHPGGAE